MINLLMWIFIICAIVAFGIIMHGYLFRKSSIAEAHRIALSVSPYMNAVEKLFEKVKGTSFTEGELVGLQVILLLQISSFTDKLMLLASEHVANPEPAWSVLNTLAYSKDADWVIFTNSLKEKLDEQIGKKGFSNAQLAEARKMHDLLHELGLVMAPIREQLKVQLAKSEQLWKSES